METRRLVLLLLLIISIVAGCASHHPRSGGPKLSKAMKKSSDKNMGDRKIDTEGRKSGSGISIGNPLLYLLSSDSEYADSSKSRSRSEKKKEKVPKAAGIDIDTGIFRGDDFFHLYHTDLFYGFYPKEKERLEGFIGMGHLLVDETAELNYSIDDAWIWNIGLRYKRYTTADHTFLGHYFTLGLSYNYLHWTYENDILVDDRTVGSDGLAGLEFFGGMGFNLAQTKNYHLGVEVLPSVIIWNAHTDEGFEDDVFGSFFMLKFRLTMSYISKPK